MKRDQHLTVVIILLVAGGVVSRLILGLLSHRQASPEIPTISVFIGFVIAQAMLFGLWGGLARVRLVYRIAGVVLGTFMLWALWTIEFWGHFDARYMEMILASLFIFYFPTVVVMSYSGWLRYRRARLQRFSIDGLPRVSDTLQFSIWNMMVATVAAAVLVTLAKIVRAYYFDGRPDEVWSAIVFAIWLALAYPMTAIVALWATLGLNRPAPRLILVAVSAVAASLLPLTFIPLDREGAIVYIASCLIQTAIVTTVLLVARRAGYRLVPLRLDPY